MELITVKQNIRKAQDEIDRLDEEAPTPGSASKTSCQRSGDVARKPVENEDTNGHFAVAAEDAVADTSNELQKASLGDQE
jgi:hypothetical protein